MQNLKKTALSRKQGTKKPVKKAVVVPLPRVLAQVTKFQAGYRKHPSIFRGVKSVLKLAEVSSMLKKFDSLEVKEEKLEQELKKIRTERNKLAAATNKKIVKSREIARALLSRADARDFCG